MPIPKSVPDLYRPRPRHTHTHIHTPTDEIACDTEGFSALCSAIETAGLADALSSNARNLTVFAPTDQAFIDLIGDGGSVTLNREILEDLLLYHAIGDVVVLSSDLQCDAELSMANLETTTV